MANIFLVRGAGEDTEMLIIYGTCIAVILLIVGIRFTNKKLRQLIQRKKERAATNLREQELLKDKDIFGMDDLYIGV